MSSKTWNVAELPKHGRVECGLLAADEETAPAYPLGAGGAQSTPLAACGASELTLQTHPR